MQTEHDIAATLQSWVSLHEASAIIGVAPSTIRRWADNGKIPIRRTVGGHRRFLKTALLAMFHNENQTVPAPQPHMHLQISDRDFARQLANQEWHTRMVSHVAGNKMRSLGQQLLGLMIQHINSHDVNSRFLADARAVGASYGSEARSAAISMHDMVEAFLFFRRAVSQFAIPVGGITHPGDLVESEDLRQRLDRFMDEILLGAVESYENTSQIEQTAHHSGSETTPS